MILKDQEVRVRDLAPELIFGLMIFEGCYRRQNGNREIVITATSNGQHGGGKPWIDVESSPSLHYPKPSNPVPNKVCAADVRANDIPIELGLNIISEAKRMLDRDFDIMLENAGTERAHFHIEYQPKQE